MPTFRIASQTSGASLGEYEAATAAEALDKMAQAAGYDDRDDAAAEGFSCDDLVVTEGPKTMAAKITLLMEGVVKVRTPAHPQGGVITSQLVQGILLLEVGNLDYARGICIGILARHARGAFDLIEAREEMEDLGRIMHNAVCRIEGALAVAESFVSDPVVVLRSARDDAQAMRSAFELAAARHSTMARIVNVLRGLAPDAK